MSANDALISANGTARPRPANVPRSAISRAAARNPAQAARASAPPTLIRRTPSAASSATVAKSLPASTLTGFGRHRLHDGGDVGRGAQARRVEAVGAGVGVRGQPANRLGQIGPTDDESFGSAGQHDVPAAVVDRSARRLDPLDGQREVEERPLGDRRSSLQSTVRRRRVCVAAATLAATSAGSIANPPSKSAFTGTSTPSAIARRCASASSSAHPVVGPPQRPRETGAGRGQRAESRAVTSSRALPRSQGLGITKQPDS